MLRFLLVLYLGGLSLDLIAQALPPGRFSGFRVANDVLYLPVKTDQYFTAGIDIYGGKRWTIGRDSLRETRWRVRQNIYTPRNIEASGMMLDDRPYASYLTVARRWSGLDRTTGWGWLHGFEVGILGRGSYGGRVQDMVHKAVDFAEPLPGWTHEVRGEPILQYTAGLARTQVLGDRGRAVVGGRLTAGTLRINARGRAGLDYDLARWGTYGRLTLSGEVIGSIVDHDATLTGGFLRPDERYRSAVLPETFVLSWSPSGELRTRFGAVSGGIVYLSPEFRGGERHVYGWVGAEVTW